MSLRDKRTSLEYGQRPSVSPGESYQDSMNVIPYQWIDNNFILKHSEFKKPYSMSVDSYQDMEYESDIPSPFYPPGISLPSFPTPRKYTSATPSWQRERRLRQPGKQFSYPAFRPPVKPPRPNQKNVGQPRNITPPTKNRTEPGQTAVKAMRQYAVYYNLNPEVYSKKPRPGGKYQRVFNGSSAWQGQWLEGCSGAESIGYVSQQMGVNDIQSLTVVNGYPGRNYSFSVKSGGGSITSDGVYTAPATNAECANNPVIALKCPDGTEAATLKLAVDSGGYGCTLAWQTCCNFSVYSCITSYNCANEPGAPCFTYSSCQCATGLFSGASCGTEGTTDARTEAMITGGCCPAGLL